MRVFTPAFVAPSARRALALVWLMVIGVGFATTLGVMHRAAHGNASGVPAAVSTRGAGEGAGPAFGAVQRHAHAAGPSMAAGILRLFGLHDDADCRLYDQLSHGAAPLSVPVLALPVMLPAATFAYLEGEAVARWVSLFDARGPPDIR